MAAVAFVTHAPLRDTRGRIHSEIGALRRHLLIPARLLHAGGVRTYIVSLDTWPREQLRRILGEADRVVFSELFATPGEAQPYATGAHRYVDALSMIPQAERRSLFVVDELSVPHDFRAALAKRGMPCIASGDCLEPCEGSPGQPSVPSRTLWQRAAAALARRTGVGLHPWRMRLLWYDEAPDVGAITSQLPELHALADEVPIRLECMIPAQTVAAGSAAQQASEDLNVVISPWSLEGVAAALARCDAVLLSATSRSPSPLLEALNAGRFAVGPRNPAFERYAAYARLGEPLSQAIRWLLTHPREALDALTAGQAYVGTHHSNDAVAEFWFRKLLPDG